MHAGAIVTKKLSSKEAKRKHMGFRPPAGKLGRPPNPDAVRDANGKSRGESSESAMAVVLSQPHRKQYGGTTLAECQHGHYRLGNHITELEHSAGIKYRDDRQRSQAAIQVPDSLRRSEGSGGGKDIPMDLEAYKAAQIKLNLDRDARHALESVLFRNQRLPWGEFVHYKRALIRLVSCYGLTIKARRANIAAVSVGDAGQTEDRKETNEERAKAIRLAQHYGVGEG